MPKKKAKKTTEKKTAKKKTAKKKTAKKKKAKKPVTDKQILRGLEILSLGMHKRRLNKLDQEILDLHHLDDQTNEMLEELREQVKALSDSINKHERLMAQAEQVDRNNSRFEKKLEEMHYRLDTAFDQIGNNRSAKLTLEKWYREMKKRLDGQDKKIMDKSCDLGRGFDAFVAQQQAKHKEFLQDNCRHDYQLRECMFEEKALKRQCRKCGLLTVKPVSWLRFKLVCWFGNPK